MRTWPWTASVASTDSPAASFAAPVRTAEYLVPDWVRVREEDFGLLFYDTRSTRLTFVRSARYLVAPPFTGPRHVVGVPGFKGDRLPTIDRLLQILLAKGLIVAAEAE